MTYIGYMFITVMEHCPIKVKEGERGRGKKKTVTTVQKKKTGTPY